MEQRSNHILPSSAQVLNDEEEYEIFIKETLQSQKEFEGLNLNQVN